LTVFFNNGEFLNVLRFGFFSYQYFCHKLMRWLVPFFMLGALVANGILAVHSRQYLLNLCLQALFYFAALAGTFIPALTKAVFIRIPSFFVVVNPLARTFHGALLRVRANIKIFIPYGSKDSPKLLRGPSMRRFLWRG
jgi:hypothetical protein